MLLIDFSSSLIIFLLFSLAHFTTLRLHSSKRDSFTDLFTFSAAAVCFHYFFSLPSAFHVHIALIVPFFSCLELVQ